jgi:hypothetical protein
MEYTLHKLPNEFVITSTYDSLPFNVNGKSLNLNGKLLPIIAQQVEIDFSELKEDDCKKIGWLDAEIYADIHVQNCGLYNFFDEDDITIIKLHYTLAFQKAQELLSDKIFTEDDMKNAIIHSSNQKMFKEHFDIDTYLHSIKKIYPKEWKVELQMDSNTNLPKLTNKKYKILNIL